MMTKAKTRKRRRWSLAQIYHHVLRQSPSPEAAKIAISEARLHLWGEQREHIARPNLRLDPGEKPPPLDPEITPDCLLPTVQYRSWDWERGRASWTDPETRSLFEYLGIYGLVDDVLEHWPEQAERTEGVKPRVGLPRRDTRGVKSEIDWEEILCVAAVLMVRNRFKKLVDLEKAVFKHFGEGWPDGGPAVSTMQQHLGALHTALKEALGL
jgi:hypothetical protein